MPSRHDEIMRLFAESDGVLRCAQHPHLAASLQRMAQRQEVTRLLPGVVTLPGMANSPHVLMRAVHLWRPEAVLLGRAAAAFTWWPSVPLRHVEVSVDRVRTRLPAGIVATTTNFSGSLLMERHRRLALSPAATALWCAARADWDPVCRGLRKRVFTAQDLADVAGRAPANEAIAWRDCAKRARRSPWSVAELDLHDELFAAEFRGWEGNPTMVLEGRTLFPDVRFKASRTIVEVDSVEWHSTEEERAKDDVRRNLFTSHGWRVLNIRPDDLRADPRAVLDRIAMVVHRRELPR